MLLKNKEGKISKIAVLASGSGTNLQAIIDAIKHNEIKNSKIAIVISNKKDAFALQRAKDENIKAAFINPKDFATGIEYDNKIVSILKGENIDLIVLAGYLKILSNNFIDSFPNKIINIHPSLLPKFGGKGMYGKYVHEAVLKAKEKQSGCTTHFVITDVDAGQIIEQVKVPVLANDTVDTLAKKVLKEENKLIVKSIKKLLNERNTATKL